MQRTTTVLHTAYIITIIPIRYIPILLLNKLTYYYMCIKYMPLHVECGNAIGDSTILRSTTSANISIVQQDVRYYYLVS